MSNIVFAGDDDDFHYSKKELAARQARKKAEDAASRVSIDIVKSWDRGGFSRRMLAVWIEKALLSAYEVGRESAQPAKKPRKRKLHKKARRKKK